MDPSLPLDGVKATEQLPPESWQELPGLKFPLGAEKVTVPVATAKVVEPDASETTAVQVVGEPTGTTAGAQLRLVEVGLDSTLIFNVPELDVWLPSPK
jgi:hypothetical protein